MMVGSTWNANTRPKVSTSEARLPKTKVAPASEKDNIRVTARLMLSNTIFPADVLSMKTAKASWSARPQPTIRKSMALRLLDNPYAVRSISKRPPALMMLVMGASLG